MGAVAICQNTCSNKTCTVQRVEEEYHPADGSSLMPDVYLYRPGHTCCRVYCMYMLVPISVSCGLSTLAGEDVNEYVRTRVPIIVLDEPIREEKERTFRRPLCGVSLLMGCQSMLTESQKTVLRWRYSHVRPMRRPDLYLSVAHTI